MARQSNQDTERTRRATDETSAVAEHVPKKGEVFRCEQCGTELEITVDCKCGDPEQVHFECCGEKMIRA